MKRLIRWMYLLSQSKPGDWMQTTRESFKKPYGRTADATLYNPDKEFEDIANTPVLNPILQFQEALQSNKATVREAWLFEGRFDKRGKLLRDETILEALGTPIGWRTRYVEGTAAFKASLREGERQFRNIGKRASVAMESKQRYLAGIAALKEKGHLEESFDVDTVTQQYDAAQYTEYAPLYAGPFNKQLYLNDYLQMHARAFEARNHNPLAKRIVDVLSQYAFGRRFKVRATNDKVKKIWDDFEDKWNIIHKLCEFWSKEYLTYGEIMLDKKIWQSIDPSTVWDIITDPDDITDVYYYYQSYSTAFQTFTGYRVPGAPGSQNAKPLEYIIRQVPARQVIHVKGNVVSQEKRGRSMLFPILGWLKRIKDLYNARVIKAQITASFIWDVKITGDASDVSAYAAAFSGLPPAGSMHVHNEQVERTPMPAMPQGSAGADSTGDEILAFIATAVGIPKEYFNIMGAGAGSRVGGLVGAEPFEKVIEDLQAKGEHLLHEIAKAACEEASYDYQKGDLETRLPKA